MPPFRLHLVRHAPVIGHEGFIYGDSAACDLASQSQAVARLAEILPNPQAAAWGCSGVPRANASARAVLAAKKAADSLLTVHAGFREQDFGALIGRSHADAAPHVSFVAGRIYAPAPPGGETIPAFVARIAAALAELRDKALRSGHTQSVVFCHGGTIRAARLILEDRPAEEFIALDTPPLGAFSWDMA